MSDAIDEYIRKLRAQFDENSNRARTRYLAIGYAFGRADERAAGGGDRPEEDNPGRAFADFYEQNTDGNWADLADQYAAFQSRKDSSSE